MFQLDADLPPALAPLAWLVGRWEGAGVVGYPSMDSVNFGQEVVVSHDGRPFLEWHSHTWLLDETGAQVRPLATELGFWRPQEDGEVELVLAHNTGIVELYYGRAEPARIDLRTDGVLRSPTASPYAAGTRLYGLVDSQLLWAFDMATADQSLTSHASAQLKRVS
jgi:hypothetical protein